MYNTQLLSKNTLVCITSYNRKSQLLNLIDEVSLSGFDYVIFDDKSDFKLDDKRFIQNPTNLGKKGFYKIWNKMLDYCRSTRYENFIFLQDDMKNVKFPKILNELEAYYNQNFILHLLNDRRPKCWTIKNNQKYDLNYERIFWVDCIFATNRKTIQNLKISVDPKRWDKSENMSSGVGQYISKYIQRNNILTLRPYNSLANLYECDSKMHFIERERNTLKPVTTGIPIVVSMATIGDRPSISKTIESIKNQTIIPDYFYIYDNSKEDINLTDNGKFFSLLYFEDPVYFFTIDDDIYYPPTYIEDTLNKLILYNDSVVTYHGRKLKDSDLYYKGGHITYPYNKTLNQDTDIDVCGTGVTAFNTELINPTQIIFDKRHRQTDLIFSEILAERGIKIKCLSRQNTYLKSINNYKNSCYGTMMAKDQELGLISQKIYRLNNG